MKDVMEEQRVKFQAAHEQENKEMADAAYQTIKTLNEMLEQKKAQVRSKEEQIDKLRQQMAEQRELAAEQYMQLQAEVTATGKSTLANLHRMVSREEAPTSGGERRAEDATRRQYEVGHQKTQKELDRLGGRLRETQDALEAARAELTGERRAKQALKEQYEDMVRGLEDKVRQERDKREKVARSRVQKNEKLIEKFQQQMVDYEAEILKLKDNNEVLRLKSMSAPQKTTSGDKGLPAASGTDKQVVDLQALVKKRDQELVKLKEKDIKSTKERQELASKLSDAENKLADEKKKVTKYLKEKDEALGSLRNARQQAEAERFNKERYKEDLDKLIAEKRGTGAGGLSYSEMASKLKALENDVYVLEAQRKTVLAINPRTSAFEYIGEALQLDKDSELKSVEEVVQALKDWLARSTNDRLSVLQVFEGLDQAESGEVTLKNFESALSRLGVKLRAGETELLKEVLDPRHVGYLQYRSLVRELQGVPQLDFMNKAVIKLAKVAESRDLGKSQFLSLLDPNNAAMMTLEQF
jgi:chromosome segregation ATPase